ncbi:MAG TPA: hypothetical protein VNR00_16355 [Opitutus sp.]|nr:hypothetical protein [Opitutus sp.]
MNSPFHVSQYPRRIVWFMAIAWAVIVGKCAAVWWAVGHWNLQFSPFWVIGPTLTFAALVTLIWLTHHEE